MDNSAISFIENCGKIQQVFSLQPNFMFGISWCFPFRKFPGDCETKIMAINVSLITAKTRIKQP